MYTIHGLHCPKHPYPINMWLSYSSMTIVTLAKVSKLGGELEEERQLNKSLREASEILKGLSRILLIDELQTL